MNGFEDFYRGWESYAAGFGDLSAEFWYGKFSCSSISPDSINRLHVPFLRHILEFANLIIVLHIFLQHRKPIFASSDKVPES